MLLDHRRVRHSITKRLASAKINNNGEFFKLLFNWARQRIRCSSNEKYCQKIRQIIRIKWFENVYIRGKLQWYIYCNGENRIEGGVHIHSPRWCKRVKLWQKIIKDGMDNSAHCSSNIRQRTHPRKIQSRIRRSRI